MLYSRQPLLQESTFLHHTENALNDFPSFINSDVAPMSIGASAPIQFRTSDYPLTPAIANSDSALPTVFSSTALIFGRAPNAALHGALSESVIPLRDHDYATDTYPRPWPRFAAAVRPERNMHASCVPHTPSEEGNAAVMQSGSSQDPSEVMIDLSLLGQRQTQPTDYHAVEAPTQTETQPTSHPTFPWLSIQPAGFLNVSTSAISQISWAQAHYQGQTQTQAPIPRYQMADPVLEQAPPRIVGHPRRRRHRGAQTRSERVVCNQCKKYMCRQSLRRHIREVHDNIKRSYLKSTIAVAGVL